ncbi:MAG: MATE family efflux transporter [Paracoccaceae bacterium]|nr:MATE family efflux transporter [Paracoccaceae bacterium]
MQTETKVITHWRVLKIAIPVVLANITLPILGAVDTAVVGQMGAAAPIGAVGIGAIILGALYWLFGFLRMGTVGLASQAFGVNERAELAALLTRVLCIGGAGGVVLVGLQKPLFWMAFQISPASAEVEGMARQYMMIRVYSAPAAIAIFGITGWLVAQERTTAILGIQLFMNGLNIALDLWFVLGLDWGVSGVAFATFIAEWSGLALALWLCRETFLNPLWRDWTQVFDKTRLWLMWLINRDILIRSLCLEIIAVSFLFMGADFGDVTLAANQILLQFLMVTSHGLDGFAFAAEALVGQAFGARMSHELRRAALLSGGWGCVTAMGLAALFALCGGLFIDLMTTSPDVRDAARLYLPYIVLTPILAVFPYILDGIFVGATRSRDMRNMMFLSLLAYGLAIFTVVPVMGSHGLWIALLVSFIVRGVTLSARYPALERAAAGIKQR